MYADDMALFLSPSRQDLHLANAIFELFQASSSLGCNISKCQIVPIRCDDVQVQLTQELFPCPIKEFLIQYLGVPLSTTKLSKSALQPLTDRMANRLPAWKGRLLHRSGRLTLIKTTLAVMPIYTTISHNLPTWLLKSFTTIFRAFLWSGTKATHGGKCLVTWDKVQRPRELGGLGVFYLKLIGRALRLRWP
jgi:hypothetical protein